MFKMVDCIRKMTMEKSCRYDKDGWFRMCTCCLFIAEAMFELSMTISSLQWDPSMADTDSEEFRRTAARVQAMVCSFSVISVLSDPCE